MSDFKVPRLAKGQGIKGPEFYGCCNTGLAPAIVNSSIAGRYIVGPELYVTESQFVRTIGLNPRKRKFMFDRTRTVVAFKTRASAVKLFCKLCEAAKAQNDKIADEHRRDLAAAKAGDLEAALRLGDY